MLGRVIKYVEERGFGFIVGEDGDRYFFHITNTNEPLEIGYGVYVDFEYDQNEKGWYAYDISLVDDEDEDEEEEEEDDEEEDDEYDYEKDYNSVRNSYKSLKTPSGYLYLEWHNSAFGGGWHQCATCGSTRIIFPLLDTDSNEAVCPNCGEGYIVYV